MKNLSKILIIPILLCCFVCNITSADNSDCGKFGGMTYKDSGGFPIVDTLRGTGTHKYTNFLTIGQQNAIITKDDLNTAILNLKKYCCENEVGGLKYKSETCKKDMPYFNENVPNSSSLFDHLFDVIMRRLNGLDGEKNIYTKTKMTLDPVGKERREWISSQALSNAGSAPQTIVNKYQQTRKISPSNLGYNLSKIIPNEFGNQSLQNFDTFLLYVSGNGKSEDSKSVANALRNYDKRTLYDRHLNACALTEYFYALLSDFDSNSVNKVIKIVSDGSCNKVIQKQIESENSYVELITKRSSNLFLTNYVEGYVSYMYKRQEKLQKLWKDTSDRWLDIIKAIPCLQPECVR